MTTPEAKAREIAERHGWYPAAANLVAALVEALHFQPLPEWSETMKPIMGADEVALRRQLNPTPTKPDELPEWALREACSDLGVTWQEFTTLPRTGILKAVLPYARLLVRIKELDGPKEDPDLVLAREMAAQGGGLNALQKQAILDGHWDVLQPVQSALRTIKHLRDAGWKEG